MKLLKSKVTLLALATLLLGLAVSGIWRVSVAPAHAAKATVPLGYELRNTQHNLHRGLQFRSSLWPGCVRRT